MNTEVCGIAAHHIKSEPAGIGGNTKIVPADPLFIGVGKLVKKGAATCCTPKM